METTANVIAAGVLRAAFVIIGFLWGVIIVQNKENGAKAKAFGFAIMVIFFLIGVYLAQ